MLTIEALAAIGPAARGRDIDVPVLTSLLVNRSESATLARETDIAADRCLTRDEFLDVLGSLADRRCIKRGLNAQGLPICYITETGRAVLNG